MRHQSCVFWLGTFLGTLLSMPALANEWGVKYTSEAFNNLQGGIEEKGGYLDNLDMTAKWDGLDIFAPDATLFAYVLANHGDSPSERVGEVQGFSNIEAPQSIKLYELWLEQPFNAGRSSWKIGLIDLNSEFYSTDTSRVFQNPSFGIGPDFSQSGVNGPSIFPTTSLGLRISSRFQENAYGQCIALDGVPGDPDNAKGTHIKFESSDGALVACEAGWRKSSTEESSEMAKFGLGLWTYSADTDRLDGSGAERNGGVYLLGEQTLVQYDKRSLAGFARFGFANDKVNQIARYQSVGVVWNGVWFDDASDKLGVGVSSVENGNAFIQSEAANGNEYDRRETTFECVYRFALKEWLTLQPSLQYIQNPGMAPGLDNALAFSVRIELSKGGKW